MNIRTLESHPQKLNECLKLIEQSFGYSDNYSFKQDFNLLINKDNFKNCYFIEQDNQVTATVFTLPRILTFKSHQLSVLFIGGISVDANARGQGLFRELFETVITLNNSYALFFLWSDLSDLYEKFKFYEFGEISEQDPSNQTVELKNIGYEEFNKLSIEYKKLSKEFLITNRQQKDWELLWANQSIEKKIDQDNNTFFIHKGMDLQNIIHESYPLDTANNTQFLKWNFKTNNNENLVNRYMGFMRLGNIQNLSHFISQVSNDTIKIIETENDKVHIHYLNEPYILSEKDFIQGLWGPGRIEEWNNLIPKILIFGFDAI